MVPSRELQVICREIWTESIAAGSEDFLKEIGSRNGKKKKLHVAMIEDGPCYIKENLSRLVSDPYLFRLAFTNGNLRNSDDDQKGHQHGYGPDPKHAS
jgi:hypothetical protein